MVVLFILIKVVVGISRYAHLLMHYGTSTLLHCYEDICMVRLASNNKTISAVLQSYVTWSNDITIIFCWMDCTGLDSNDASFGKDTMHLGDTWEWMKWAWLRKWGLLYQPAPQPANRYTRQLLQMPKLWHASFAESLLISALSSPCRKTSAASLAAPRKEACSSAITVLKSRENL